MLWFIGIGVDGYKGLSFYALEALERCTIIYVDRYSSAVSENELRGLYTWAEKKRNEKIAIISAQRWFVEDGREILEQAKHSNVALLTYGDPLIATTLTELYVRAIKSGVKVNVIHGASGLTSIIGETGLHIYKFGRVITITSEPQSAVSVYNATFDNLLAGNHTLILTEFNNNQDKSHFLDPVAAIKSLTQAEQDLKYDVFSEDTFIIVASRIGTLEKKIISGKVRSLVDMNFGSGPHSMIITGSLHFTELEAIMNLTHNLNEPQDNTLNIRQISIKMIEKYAPKARQAIKNMKSIIRKETNAPIIKGSIEVLDNAEYYIDDSERFLKQGKLELAVLSIGYAEGLIDALHFQKGFNPWDSQ